MAETIKPRKQLTLDLSDAAFAKLESMKYDLNVPSNAEVINRSLKLMAWLLRKRDNHEKVYVGRSALDLRIVDFTGVL